MNVMSIRRLLSLLAFALAAMFFAAAPASAAQINYFKIAPPLSKADFGNGTHQFGQPTQDGTLTWSGSVTAKLSGTVYMDNLLGGGCARVRMEFYPDASTKTTKYSAQVCRSGAWFGDVPSGGVSLSASAATAYKVVVTTQYKTYSGSAWSNTGSKTLYR